MIKKAENAKNKKHTKKCVFSKGVPHVTFLNNLCFSIPARCEHILYLVPKSTQISDLATIIFLENIFSFKLNTLRVKKKNMKFYKGGVGAREAHLAPRLNGV